MVVKDGLHGFSISRFQIKLDPYTSTTSVLFQMPRDGTMYANLRLAAFHDGGLDCVLEFCYVPNDRTSKLLHCRGRGEHVFTFRDVWWAVRWVVWLKGVSEVHIVRLCASWMRRHHLCSMHGCVFLDISLEWVDG